ncbi:hypothetical protein C8D97_1322 [Pleionea mediterranea]|uniref:Uncharacterized protein n=1 Tax=Pleionea mediterranea TaxID=523701 RepID=A0A316FNP5_9GAMM|nr:hypothetical protein C8D97_1322 [Pleionea mediterranea]
MTGGTADDSTIDMSNHQVQQPKLQEKVNSLLRAHD